MKKNKDDLRYIEDCFEKEQVTAPASLGEQAMFDKLNRNETEKHPVKMQRSKRKTVKSIVAVAACFAIIVGAGRGAYVFSMSGKAQPFDNMTGLCFFTSYRQLNNTMKEIDRKNNSLSPGDLFSVFDSRKYAVESDMAAEESAAVGNSASLTTADGAASFAVTNKQVDAVDEADIIKTDGRYIYYVPYGGAVKIYAAENGTASNVATISMDSNVNIEEMYLLDNTLIAVGTHFQYYTPPVDYGREVMLEENTEETEAPEIAVETTATQQSDATATTEAEPTEAPSATETEPPVETTTQQPETTTAPASDSQPPTLEDVDSDCAIALTYDITDRTAPVLTDYYEQSGTYLSSRITGGVLYLVSYYHNYDKKIPVCGTGGSCEQLPIDDIVAVEGCNGNDFAVIGAVDTAGGDSTQTKAILGVGSDIYCNESNLYLFGDIYEYSRHRFDYSANTKTQIVRYSLDGLSVTLAASARVDGTADNQFSLDEKDGYLRIATTSTDSQWNDTNNLYVLDEGLNEIGKVTGFANNEHIEAVRYVGDTAYVITFERTDPLFIIDLSNPAKPQITGEVKIDGFSTFLTPVDENTLLGIGYYTEENGYGGVYTDGLKLALFDVSDKNHPKVLDEASFPNAYSAAQETHKALVHNSEKGYYAIPLTVDTMMWNEYGEEIPLQLQYGNGILQFTLDGGRFSLKNFQANIETQRCTFIGDYLYAVSEDGDSIVSFPAP